MKTTEKLKIVRHLFVNRDDTYVVQWKNNEGDWQYWRVANGKGDNRELVPLDDKALMRHMDYERTVGVYALDELDRCKWVCIDVDIEKGYEDADATEKVQLATRLLIQSMREHTDKLPMVVEYSGGRGYHVWLFSEKMPAEMSRAIGLYFAGTVVPPKGISFEVYPKSAVVDTVGSLVKLPLGKHQKTGKTCDLVDFDLNSLDKPWDTLSTIQPWPMEWWKSFMTLNDIDEIPDLRFERRQSGETKGLPCITNMFSRGAEEGQRDEAAFVLANFLVQYGLPDDVAMAALEAWNMKNSKPLKPSTLQTKLNSAIRNNYSTFPCQREKLDPFCDPNCKFYANKMKTRGLA